LLCVLLSFLSPSRTDFPASTVSLQGPYPTRLLHLRPSHSWRCRSRLQQRFAVLSPPSASSPSTSATSVSCNWMRPFSMLDAMRGSCSRRCVFCSSQPSPFPPFLFEIDPLLLPPPQWLHLIPLPSPLPLRSRPSLAHRGPLGFRSSRADPLPSLSLSSWYRSAVTTSRNESRSSGEGQSSSSSRSSSLSSFSCSLLY
jgi:hypothetical protein